MSDLTRHGSSQGGDLSWPLRRAARLFGGRDAIIAGGVTRSYAELAARVSAVGGGLDALGITPGARVGHLGANTHANLEFFLGAPASGRVFVDLNFRLSEPELAFIVNDCDIELLVVEREDLHVARALRARCPGLRTLVLDGLGPATDDLILYEELIGGGPNEPREISPRDLALISYTGGTTGTPKGVMLSHANLLANARHNLIATGHRQSDRWLHVCPMFHVAGSANVIAATWVGAAQVVLPRFTAPGVIETILREGITHTLLVPTMLAMLLEQLDDLPDERLQSLVHIQYAASPISPELQRRVLEGFECDIAQFYGMTEAAPTVSHLSPQDHRVDPGSLAARRLDSIGTPVVGVEAEIRDAEGRPLPPEEIGELWVRGPNVMLGYWNRPDATAAAFAGDWYRTADAVRADVDGYLYVVDRLKDMIISGGENVYSIEVEATLSEHDAVAEAAVFGIPDARWGEAVHAVVTVREGRSVTAEQLIEHCRERIAGYKIPRSVEVTKDPLPKSGAGKLLKNRLRDPFWAGHERRVN